MRFSPHASKSAGSVRSGDAAQIELTAVTKTYEGKAGAVQALASTDLTIAPGSFTTLVGPSGCGKSTILNVVAGLIPLTSGEVKIGDRVVRSPDRSVGIVFQKPTLLSWYSILKNVLMPSLTAHTFDDGVKERAIELLETTGLADVMHRLPHELSGGMQQRAAIVRALVNRPQILLMDEPFSALDEFTRESLNDEVLRLWAEQQQTVLFITHSITEAVYLSDQVVVMERGPGRVNQIIPIELPRPRNPSMRTTPEFYEYESKIRSLIGFGNAKKAGASR